MVTTDLQKKYGRCPECYGRLDAMHRSLGKCPKPLLTPQPKRTPKSMPPRAKQERQSRRFGHGTRACYARGCKRPECREAAAKYSRDRNKKLGRKRARSS